MTKYLFVAALAGVLLCSEGCRRQNTSRSAGSVTSQSTPDSTGSVRQTANVPTDSARTSGSAGSAIGNLSANVADVAFRYLTAKSKISFKSEKQEIDNASVSVRIQRDSLIWVSVSKLGIEAARVLVTRDSILIMDKINRAYAASDFATLSKRFGFTLNYALLQSLLVGNSPFPGQPAQKSKDAAGNLVFRQQDGSLLIDNYIAESDHKLNRLVISQQPGTNALRAEFAEFGPVTNYLFPFSSVLTLDYRAPADGKVSQTVLQSKYSKVELIDSNPGFPFTIPASYQRRP